MVFQLYRLMRY